MKTKLPHRLLALMLSALLLISALGAAALAEGTEVPSPGVGGEDCTHPEELREVRRMDPLYGRAPGDREQDRAA